MGYLMVARLATLCPTAVLQRLDRLVEPLRSTCTTKVKANAVKQEYEKQDELKRSAMRAVAALLFILDSDKNPQLNEFVLHIRSSPDLQVLQHFSLFSAHTNINSERKSIVLDTYYLTGPLRFDPKRCQRTPWKSNRLFQRHTHGSKLDCIDLH